MKSPVAAATGLFSYHRRRPHPASKPREGWHPRPAWLDSAAQREHSCHVEEMFCGDKTMRRQQARSQRRGLWVLLGLGVSLGLGFLYTLDNDDGLANIFCLSELYDLHR